MITDNNIRRQNIMNLERSILIHILNKSPKEKLTEIRNKIKRLWIEINKSELSVNGYYYGAYYNRSSPSPAIGYGEWKAFTPELSKRVKNMSDEEVKDICGVNPDLLSPEHHLEWTGDMKNWGEQTYAKDEGYTPFTLKGLQKLWKAIGKEKKSKLIAWDYGVEGNDYTTKVYGYIDKKGEWHIEKVTRRKNKKKEKRKRMKVLILTKIIGGIVKYKKVKSDSKLFFYRQGYSHKINDEVYCYDDKKIWRIFKILQDKKKKERMLILKNVKTGKHYQVPINSRYSFKTTKDPKIGDIVFKVDKEDMSKVNECRVVKILEYDKDRKKKGRPILLILENVFTKMKIHYMTPYKEGGIRYKIGDELLLYCQYWKVLKIIKQRKSQNLRGTSPKGAVFSEYSTGFGDNEFYREHLRRVARCKERSKLIHIIDEKAKRKELSEFHQRPYLKTILEEVKGKPRGEENLEKVEFPCYCEFNANNGSGGDPSKSYKVHGIGKIDKTFTEGQVQYQLSWVDRQQGLGNLTSLSVLCSTPSLKRLFDIYDINILKAEVKVWKEVGEYTKKE